MDAEFWHRRWQENEIAFHEGEANHLLAKHFEDTCGKPGSRVFLPLCGKTRDIDWLMSRGYRVAGAELSQTAVEQLFADLEITPERAALGSLSRYSADGIDIFVGDIFDVTPEVLGTIDVIYDRAALVALPEDMRPRYATHLMRITAMAPQFLITFTYDQTLMDGPPFSISDEEIRRCYGDRYDQERITEVDVPGGLKGLRVATESVWLLRPDKVSD